MKRRATHADTTVSRAAKGGASVVWAALFGNMAVAVVKLAAAVLTGSSAMLSEGVHSLVDTSNELLLIYGLRRAAKPPDLEHPYGYGRELYFWSFIVSLLIFAVGAGVSFYEGVTRVISSRSIQQPEVVFAVLAFAFVFEGASWIIALREFRRKQGSLTLWQAFRTSKDPTTFMVLFEDSAALLGILIAAGGTGLALTTGQDIWDGAASIVIALLLSIVAALLARESKELLIGEPALPALRASILELAGSIGGVERINGMTTVQLSPHQVIANLSVEFDDDQRTPDIERSVKAMEDRIRAVHPNVVAVFVKPQTARVARAHYAHIVEPVADWPVIKGKDATVRCRHLETIAVVTPSARGCEDCLRIGSHWLHLRLCRACGHVGCCDQSKNRHAAAHFEATHHPIIEGYDPPEGWGWCYIDKVMIDLDDNVTERDGPIPRFY